jgi:nicotinate-nucleotide adenylyltransferase
MNIAIYSGSFNPVHNGHLSIARAALNAGIDELWFMVSPQNPLKENAGLWPESDRLEMVKLAIADEPKMKASDFEFNLPRPSYTIKTLCELQRKFPQHRFRLLIGGDNLANFGKWREHDKILEEFGLLVYPRPGHHSPVKNHPNITMIAAPLLDISSTIIRARWKSGQTIDGLVPDKVKSYMEKMKSIR